MYPNMVIFFITPINVSAIIIIVVLDHNIVQGDTGLLASSSDPGAINRYVFGRLLLL